MIPTMRKIRRQPRNLTVVYNNSSHGNYPTREDFAFSNPTLLKAGLAGYPVGDLNWFPDRLLSWTINEDLALMAGMLLNANRPFRTKPKRNFAVF